MLDGLVVDMLRTVDCTHVVDQETEGVGEALPDAVRAPGDQRRRVAARSEGLGAVALGRPACSRSDDEASLRKGEAEVD